MDNLDARPSQNEFETALREKGENDLWMLAVSLLGIYPQETAESIIQSWVDDPASYDDDITAFEGVLDGDTASAKSVLDNLGQPDTDTEIT